MRNLLWASTAVFVSLSGCTEDFGQFQFNGTGGSGSTSSQGGSGPTTSSTMTTTGSTTSTTGSTTGSTTSSTTGSTTSSTTTSTTATTTSGGGVTVDCGSGGTCDISGGDVCCIDKFGASDGICKGSCNGSESPIECDHPDDCPGQVCCVAGGPPPYDSITCQATCDGSSDRVVCEPGVTVCPMGTTCQDTFDVPTGIMVCRN